MPKKLAQEYADKKMPVNINPVVDPSAALTDPTNLKFVPQTNQELESAIQAQVQASTLSREEAYEKIKKALNGDAGDDEEMSTNKIEEAIRKQVRSILKEVTLNQLPPSLRQVYLDAGAPTTGQIPQSVMDKVAARPEGPRTSAAERKKAAAAGLQEPTGEMPQVTKVGYGVSS